ncbi:trypsin [Trichuris suis]|nr:trypsin [Trichuris suis]
MPVCLPRPNKGPPEGAQCFISGWGRTVSDGSLSSTLQVIDVKILKKNRCNLVGEAKTKSLCAGNMKGGKDACQGDSGGPLVCIVKDRFVLYGITSFGVGCGQRKQPGVYVEVARREMRSERDIEVVLGAHNVHIPEERRVISAVSQYTLAPRYDPNTNGEDVALLQLRDTIDFTDTIMPVCLPKQHDPLPEDVFCYISGWGSTVYGGSASYTLRVVDVNILDEGYCDMNPQTKSNSFCAGHKEGKKDACQGDSGGPLVCFINDHFVLYGITSYGTDCGKSQKAGVYSKVAEYIDWIREQSRIPEDTFNPYE